MMIEKYNHSVLMVIAWGVGKASVGGCGDSRTVGGTSHSLQLLTEGIPSSFLPLLPSFQAANTLNARTMAIMEAARSASPLLGMTRNCFDYELSCHASAVC